VSLDFLEPGFVVFCDPVRLWPAYAPDLPPLESGREADRAVIVTVPQDPRGMTANLLAPLIFDCRHAYGQVVLEGERYSTRHQLLAG